MKVQNFKSGILHVDADGLKPTYESSNYSILRFLCNRISYAFMCRDNPSLYYFRIVTTKYNKK